MIQSYKSNDDDKGIELFVFIFSFALFTRFTHDSAFMSQYSSVRFEIQLLCIAKYHQIKSFPLHEIISTILVINLWNILSFYNFLKKDILLFQLTLVLNIYIYRVIFRNNINNMYFWINALWLKKYIVKIKNSPFSKMLITFNLHYFFNLIKIL